MCEPVYAFIQFALFVLFLFKDPYIDNNNSITEYFTMLKMYMEPTFQFRITDG